MDRKLKAARIKKVVEQQTKIKTAKNPHLLHVAEFEAGEDIGLTDPEADEDESSEEELYEGVTDNAPVDSEANYRMITRKDDVTNSQGS